MPIYKKAYSYLRKHGVLKTFKKIIFYILSLKKYRIDEVDIIFKVLKNIPEAIMIDVGAHFGTSLEKFSRQPNWTIYAFEPDNENRKVLLNNYKTFKNIIIESYGLSDQKKSAIFYKSNESTGVSSLAPFTNKHYPVDEIKLITLAHYILVKKLPKITFLKVDTEGFDFKVLQGLDINNNKPRIILCEFEDNKTKNIGYTSNDLADFLSNSGYRVIVSEWEPIIRYGGNHKWSSFFKYTNQNIRKNSWGNLIACTESEDYDTIFNALKIKSKHYNKIKFLE